MVPEQNFQRSPRKLNIKLPTLKVSNSDGGRQIFKIEKISMKAPKKKTSASEDNGHSWSPKEEDEQISYQFPEKADTELALQAMQTHMDNLV